MEACTLNNLLPIIQKTMSPRKSEEDVTKGTVMQII